MTTVVKKFSNSTSKCKYACALIRIGNGLLYLTYILKKYFSAPARIRKKLESLENENYHSEFVCPPSYCSILEHL